MKKISLLFPICAIILSVILSSCNRYSKEVRNSLANMSTGNRHKFEKVLNQYISLKQKEKFKAACFLIADINDKFGLYYPKNSYFFPILEMVDSLKKRNIQTESIDSLVKKEYASVDKDGFQPEAYKDIDVISPEFLIENIDLAFDVWEKKPWAKNYNFHEFCEWILPYRVQNEPLQNWRRFMHDKLNWLADSMKNPSDPKEACILINKYIAKDFQFSHTLDFVPMLGGLDGWKFKSGICDHRYLLIVMAMRSVGIPVAIDYTPQFPRKSGNHSWTVLLDADKKIKTFNGGEPDARILYPAVCPIGIDEQVTTVFRYLYCKNKGAMFNRFSKGEIPESFQSNYIKEVTSEYDGLRKHNFSISLNADGKKKIACIFSFDIGTSINAVTLAEVRNKQVTFNNIGRGGIYIVGYNEENGIALTSAPFILPDPEGEIQTITPDLNATESVRLYRKFSVPYTMKPYIKGMLGAKIQGADHPDFSDSVTLYKIDEEINYFKQIALYPDKNYRYYRYLSSDTSDIRIAELSFYYAGPNGQETYLKGTSFGFKSKKDSYDNAIYKYAFDNDIRTNFNAPKGSWVAIDAGHPVKLTRFSIIVRNDQNVVEPGDQYELLYFNQGWYSLGKQVASDYFIDFKNVPKGAILLLKDLTKGKEERIFRYENGKQVWW